MDEDLSIPGHSRRVGGWVVAAVLLAGAGIIGFAVARPYLAPRHEGTAAAAAVDPRVQSMLNDGERALVAGDLDQANDSFVRASALAERDPHVLLDLARLADVRADIPWLKLLLLPPDASASDDQKMTKGQLDDLAARAKKAADDAVAVAPNQAPPVLTQINALRMSGDSAGARALVAKVIQGASEPDTAYALAALDLAEPEPLWPMVIERLRLAAAGEGNVGRARAALVYALARSGDAAGAKAELDKLASQTRPYALLGVLRAFMAKAPASKPDAGVRGAAGGAAVDVSSLPHPAPASARGGGGGGGGGNPGYSGPNDPRFLLAQAESAKNSHDYDRARALYSSALAQNASDSEALAGLGDVNKALHDLPGAASYYRRALAANPVYLPALVGLGDVEWESGDKDEAQKTYRDIADRFPEGAYPGRVKQRATDTGSPAPAPTSNATAAPASSNSSGASQ
jgi:tetratricopeptide (TPR) repeat protein